MPWIHSADDDGVGGIRAGLTGVATNGEAPFSGNGGSACRQLYERLEQETERLFEVVGKKRSKEPRPMRVPAKVQPTYDAITALTDTFCREHLSEEYAALSRRLTGVLGRKRPTPITRGKVESWACGIVRTIGWVNFLSDPSQTPHMKTEAISEAFGVSSATGAAKLKKIRDTLKLMPMHPEWTLPSKLEDNPLAWMVEIDGIAMDARALPKEIQQEVFRLGLIPYAPDESRTTTNAIPPRGKGGQPLRGTGRSRDRI